MYKYHVYSGTWYSVVAKDDWYMELPNEFTVVPWFGRLLEK